MHSFVKSHLRSKALCCVWSLLLCRTANALMFSLHLYAAVCVHFISRLHQQVAEKEQQNREFIERRIQAVESLKSNIAANQVSSRTEPKCFIFCFRFFFFFLQMPYEAYLYVVILELLKGTTKLKTFCLF